MKLSEWARQQGITYKTAWRMFCTDRLPVPAEQLPTGTIIVHAPAPAPSGHVVLYARVSSHDQQADPERQVARLAVFAARVRTIVVEHRERHRARRAIEALDA
jgi:putative resolvase